MSSSWEKPERLADAAFRVRVGGASGHDRQGTLRTDGLMRVVRVDGLHEVLPGIARSMETDRPRGECDPGTVFTKRQGTNG